MVNSTSIIIQNDIESVDKIISPQEMRFYFTSSSYDFDVDELEDYEYSY